MSHSRQSRLTSAPTKPAEILGNVSLFANLTSEALEAIGSHANLKTYRKNTIVIEQGDESGALYIVVSGKVKVYIADDDGNELVINVLRPFEPVGELAVLGGVKRTASVVTQEDTKLLMISKDDLFACLHQNPQIALDIIQFLVEKLSFVTDQLGSFGLQDVYGRVVDVLNKQAREEDGRLITGRLTQQEIAQMVGASRVMISRILKDLRQGDYIETENKRIVINKKLPAHW